MTQGMDLSEAAHWEHVLASEGLAPIEADRLGVPPQIDEAVDVVTEAIDVVGLGLDVSSLVTSELRASGTRVRELGFPTWNKLQSTLSSGLIPSVIAVEEVEDVVEEFPDENAIPTDDIAIAVLLPDEINRLLAPFDPAEISIMSARFGLDQGRPRTLEEVGLLLNMTSERIHEIERSAMAKMRSGEPDVS